MKIAIITLPLHTNYGGILQAYALRKVLMSYGHSVTVVEPLHKMPLPLWWKAPAIYLKRSLQRLVKGSSGPEVFREFRVRREFPAISVNTSGFVREYISPLIVKDYSDIADEFDAYVVGSDQVWRPRYFGDIRQAFLYFTKERDVLRFSYAASFGTDELEYDLQMLEQCSQLLDKFDGVSVREASAVRMCDEWLDCDRAVQVLDPVFLLDAQEYRRIACKVSTSESSCLVGNAAENDAFNGFKSSCAAGKVVTYLLDSHKNIADVVGFVTRVLSVGVYDASVPRYEKGVPVQERVVPALEKWIEAIADSEFVITDSFHVCVLSILFHKPFFVVSNHARGLSRISSLLEVFGLDSRLVQGIDPDDDGDGWLMEIDWDSVDAVLSQKRRESFEFIESCLSLKVN